jgi:high affinity sulfate transporter 1
VNEPAKPLRTASATPLIERLARIAPGLATLLRYRRENLAHDFVAGLSVAAVALPVGVAYAQLAGFNPAVGLYSSILPLAAYAIFGTSRQLIVGPDAATCALVAAAVSPLAVTGSDDYMAMSMTLAFVAGLLCIAGSFLKLGAVADYLSRPILAGFMNGIALYIALGQLGKLLGLKVASTGILRPLVEIASRLSEVHIATLVVALGSFAVMLLSPRFVPRLPAALVTLAVSALATWLFSLDAHGVATVGEVPAGLPSLALPRVPFAALSELVFDAAGIALIAFCSAIVTARSFAAKNGYDLDDDRELAAIGVANLASSISHGFAISGADSRTAMNDAAGGRTQVAALVAAGAVAVVLLLLTGPLRYVPIPALGAVLVFAAVSLVDIETLRALWREEKGEFAISIVAMLGVVTLGSIQGIVLAIVLALLRFVRIVSRPSYEVLGRVPGMPGFHGVTRHATATRTPGLCLFRFNAPIVFFNARYFKRAALDALATADTPPRWFVLDGVAVTGIDATGRHALRELQQELAQRGITFVLAGRSTEANDWLKKHGLTELWSDALRFATLRQALRAFREETAGERPAREQREDLDQDA